MTENKRYTQMTNHYGTSRTYCTGIYDNQNHRELKKSSQVINELNELNDEKEQLHERIEDLEGQLEYIRKIENNCSKYVEK